MGGVSRVVLAGLPRPQTPDPRPQTVKPELYAQEPSHNAWQRL